MLSVELSSFPMSIWTHFHRVYGGAGGTRTLCLFNAIEALSQMSYSPTRRRQTASPTLINIANAHLIRKQPCIVCTSESAVTCACFMRTARG